MKIFAVIVISLLLAPCPFVYADIKDDPRYCGEPKRDARGDIVRNRKELSKFKAMYPCESFADKFGTTCGEWQVNHSLPLVCGGCDTVANMEWQHVSVKTCALSTGVLCTDRVEQAIYCPYGGFHK